MENNSYKQISTKQFVCLTFLVTLAIKMFMLPALILRVVGRDGYLVQVFYIALEFINLGLVLAVMKRNPDKTLYDLLRDCFGKVISRVIITIFSLFVVMKGVLVFSEIKMFFSVNVYEQIEWKVLAVPMLALLGAFAVRSLRAFGRVCEFIAPLVLVSSLILAALLVGDLDLIKILPFMENGFGAVGEGILTFPMWFGDASFLLIAMGNVKIGRCFVISSLVAKAVSSVLVLGFSIMLFAAYGDISELIDYGNNISNMTQFSIGTQDFGRFDLIVYCVWLFSVFIKLALVFYVFTRNLSFVTGIKNNFVSAVITAVVFYILSVIVVSNENVMYLVATGPIKWAACPLAFAMPLIVFVCALIKYRPNRHDLSDTIKEKKKNVQNAFASCKK